MEAEAGERQTTKRCNCGRKEGTGDPTTKSLFLFPLSLSFVKNVSFSLHSPFVFLSLHFYFAILRLVHFFLFLSRTHNQFAHLFLSLSLCILFPVCAWEDMDSCGFFFSLSESVAFCGETQKKLCAKEASSSFLSSSSFLVG